MLVIRHTEGSIITGTSYDMDLLILPGSRAENIDTFIPDVYKPDEKSIIFIDRKEGFNCSYSSPGKVCQVPGMKENGMISFRIHKSEIPEFIAIIFCSPVRFLETPVLFPRRR